MIGLAISAFPGTWVRPTSLPTNQLRIAIVTWIERKYHRQRRQATLGRLTPIEFETMMSTSTAVAA